MTGRLGEWAGHLQRAWWCPVPNRLSLSLKPLAALYRFLAHRQQHREQALAQPLPVPVIVVGNLIVGGAGKTPSTLALIDALRARGWRPGVVSRGYGRHTSGMVRVQRTSSSTEVGDEPLLIHLRSGAPVMVGADRAEAGRQLLAETPELDLIVADDGLQHWRLARDLQLIVFDGRGEGNGLLLPAGPLRQALPAHLPERTWVIYNAARPSTALPGPCARRRLGGAVSLAEWWAGRPATEATLAELGRQSQSGVLLAAAGIAEPERFFTQLEATGVRIQRLSLADHADLTELPWPATTADVLITEKDAVKLAPDRVGATRVWVVTLDFELPVELIDAMDSALRRLPRFATQPV